MLLDDLKKAISPFYPALVLDALLSREARRKIGSALLAAVAVLALLAAVSALAPYLENVMGEVLWLARLQGFGSAIFGLLLIIFSLYLASEMFKAFYASYYYRGLETALPERGLSKPRLAISFEAASVVYDILRQEDFTSAFLHSRLGRFVLARLGLGQKSLSEFFAGRVMTPVQAALTFPEPAPGETLALSRVGGAIFSADREFSKFLSFQNISLKDLEGACSWVERMEQKYMRYRRFWGRDALGRIPGLGKDWAYGGSYALEKFAEDVTGVSGHELSKTERSEESELETVLSRSGEANALLVSEEGGGAMDIIFGLGAKIKKGSVLPPLEHKRLFLFDANAFIAAAKTKPVFESKFLHLLNESARTGNVILVMPDLPSFVESARSLGSEAIALMDPYLALPNFQVIAVTNPGAFHGGLGGEGKVLHRFEKILVKEEDEEAMMRTLENDALREERRGGLFFTYQSLEKVAESALRYFAGEGVASAKASRLLSEVAARASAKKKPLVEESDVSELVETKTGIPTGAVSSEERQKLLRLEEVLHERVIGQDEAVSAIANAMRRARSDVLNPERPMGSFLFLGPTGVGKTETAKALSAAFFGKEDAVIRLDMSEYQTDDALERLIGAFQGARPGVLSSRLREQPYGVLLLDEFEKTRSEALDLFLQVLDEGFFSDMAGKRVNARNLIIIATSNAGSDLIWERLHGTNPSSSPPEADATGHGTEQEHGKEAEITKLDKDVIVNEIIKRGIFKPELLNRFDGVILFHPLSAENLAKIAALMLQKLQKRLLEKGIELVVNDALLRAVVSAGTDPEFGARPMNRAIQEKVEQAVAKRIISGEVRPGTKLELTAEELA